MISVVCVYNDEITLKDALLKSLENQTSKHELILIDNTQGKFDIFGNIPKMLKKRRKLQSAQLVPDSGIRQWLW